MKLSEKWKSEQEAARQKATSAHNYKELVATYGNNIPEPVVQFFKNAGLPRCYSVKSSTYLAILAAEGELVGNISIDQVFGKLCTPKGKSCFLMLYDPEKYKEVVNSKNKDELKRVYGDDVPEYITRFLSEVFSWYMRLSFVDYKSANEMPSEKTFGNVGPEELFAKLQKDNTLVIHDPAYAKKLAAKDTIWKLRCTLKKYNPDVELPESVIQTLTEHIYEIPSNTIFRFEGSRVRFERIPLNNKEVSDFSDDVFFYKTFSRNENVPVLSIFISDINPAQELENKLIGNLRYPNDVVRLPIYISQAVAHRVATALDHDIYYGIEDNVYSDAVAYAENVTAKLGVTEGESVHDLLQGELLAFQMGDKLVMDVDDEQPAAVLIPTKSGLSALIVVYIPEAILKGTATNDSNK